MNPHGNIKHGGTGTLTHARWKAMMQRCRCRNHRSYAHYGGRGIMVCDRWLDFENFLADMGTCPDRSMTLDRIDGNGHYEPGNCRWATRAEQNRNRPDHCVPLTFNGQTKNVTDWAADLGLKATTIHSRLRLGWSVDRALSTPADGSPSANRHPKLMALTHRGQTRPLIDWAKSIGITPNTLRARLRLGWPVSKALSQALQ